MRMIEKLEKVLGLPFLKEKLCATDIVIHFPSPLPFSRGDVIKALHYAYPARMMDRALVLLEAHGICRCVTQPVHRGPGGGAVYEILPEERWHSFNEDVLMNRLKRAFLAEEYMSRSTHRRAAQFGR